MRKLSKALGTAAIVGAAAFTMQPASAFFFPFGGYPGYGGYGDDFFGEFEFLRVSAGGPEQVVGLLPRAVPNPLRPQVEKHPLDLKGRKVVKPA